MTLVEGGAGALGVRGEVVLGGIRSGDDVGGIVDGVRPGVGDEELEVRGVGLLEIDGEAVVAGGSGGEVGGHVAEGDGLTDAETIGSGEFAGEFYALACALRVEELAQRGVEAGTAEEVQERWGDVGAGGADSARRG